MTGKSKEMKQFFVIVILVGLVNYFVQGAQIDVLPDNFQVAVTDAIHINCTPDGTSARAKDILLMEISKDGAKPIVNMRSPGVISIGKDLTNRFTAHGEIDNKNIANSYLSLTIKFPQIEDAGDYTCAFSFLDEAGLLQQEKDHNEIKAIKSNSSSVDDDVRILETKVDNLLVRLAAVEKENLRLQTKTKNQSQQIDYLLDREQYIVAFSAAVDKETSIVAGQSIVFSDVVLNEGQGYNATTGVFMAPKPGLYAFHLVLEIGSGGSVGEINLNVAGQNLAKLYTQDKDYGDQSSISTVSNLKAGSEVKAVVRNAAGLNPSVFGERLCVFSGYLVSLS